ncbi:Nucleoside-diphosphate-sugar epimerase [Jhaorihella thermophila]|uniref:Nucleoside-diphosphate-sugar epimerase n=2 Tax=Jhaorihella thermophila TaxID=488547 RepID=A0A1H5Y656_9RHOB|nr:Nucleoside-diphosphate-sugar epimerase [Jhaorihella thermophila]
MGRAMHFPRILVLGATGRIGAILRRLWLRSGARTGDHVLWQARAARHGNWAVFDPRDPDAVARAARGCDTILCLAGVTPTRAARGAAMADNVRLGLAAVRGGAAAGARVLLASSAAVYGGGQGLLAETVPPAPLSDYGRAKAEMEHRAIALGAELGVSVTCLRIGNVAGADAILGDWRPGFRLDRFADGRTPRRSYVGPATLARVLKDLAAASDLPPVLNVAAPGSVEMGALLDAAGLAWTPRPAPEDAIARVQLDVSALERFTSFAPRDSLPRTMVAEWRELACLETYIS